MAEQETIRTMVDEVRSELGEPIESFFTNVEIVSWLNYAVKLFARKTRILKTKVTYAWPANTDSVSLTTVLPSVYHATLNAAGTQHDPKISMADWNDASYGYHILKISKREVLIDEPSRVVTSDKGNPVNFYYSPWEGSATAAQGKEGVVGLMPTPSTAGTLSVYYSYEQAKMVLADVTALDANMSRWWEDICAYAIYRGKLKDVDHFAPQEAQESLGRFHGAINMCRGEIAVEDGPDIIDFVTDYADPY